MDRQLAYCQFESFMQLHIPEIFSQKQIEKIRRSRINSLIYLYAEQGTGWEISEEEIRQYVLETIKMMKKYCTFSEIVCCGMIRYCPAIFKMFF